MTPAKAVEMRAAYISGKRLTKEEPGEVKNDEIMESRLPGVSGKSSRIL